MTARVLGLVAVVVAAAAIVLLVFARDRGGAPAPRSSSASSGSSGSSRSTGEATPAAPPGHAVATRPPALSAPPALLPIPGAGVVVRGTVRDLESRPVAGARIATRYGRAETDRAGAFEVRLAAGRSTMKIEADGFAIAERWVLAPSDVAIVLVPEGAIAGRVVDEAGAPVAGARVTFDRERTLVESGPDGAFAFARVPPGRYTLTALTPHGLATSFELPLGVGQRIGGIELRLRPAHQITVRGAAGCEVALHQGSLQVGSAWPDGADLRIDGVPAGHHLLAARCGDTAWTRQPIDVAGDRDVVLERPAPSGIVRGRVIAPGRGDAQLKVYATGVAGADASVEPDGTYQLSLRPGEYTLRAGERGPESDLVKVTIAANTTVERTLALPPVPDGRVVVQVVDRAGTPVPYARVELAGPTSQRVTTNRDGVETIRIAPGTYAARANGGSAQVIVAAGIERVLRIVTAADPVVRGTVVDERGAPVAGAYVAFDTDARGSITDAAGAFALVGGSPGYYVPLVAYRPGDPARASGYGAPDTAAKLVLGGAASIAGTVRRADGSVPDRFDVILRSVDSYEPRTFVQTGGAFQRAGLVAGRYQLGAALDGVATWTDLVLEPGERRADLQLVLPPLGSISGVVVDAATGAPIAAAHVGLRCDRDGAPRAFVHPDQLSAADGRFEVRELPIGTCTLMVKPPEGWVKDNREVSVPGDLGELRLARAR